MKTHTVQGALLLERIPQLRGDGLYAYAADIARHQPRALGRARLSDGLRGDEISPWAQAVSLADVYGRSDQQRVYKAALPREKALAMIQNGDCGVFGPHLLKCFFAVEERLFALYQR